MTALARRPSRALGPEALLARGTGAVVTLGEAARVTGASEAELRTGIRRGLLPVVRIRKGDVLVPAIPIDALERELGNRPSGPQLEKALAVERAAHAATQEHLEDALNQLVLVQAQNLRLSAPPPRELPAGPGEAGQAAPERPGARGSRVSSRLAAALGLLLLAAGVWGIVQNDRHWEARSTLEGALRHAELEAVGVRQELETERRALEDVRAEIARVEAERAARERNRRVAAAVAWRTLLVTHRDG